MPFIACHHPLHQSGAVTLESDALTRSNILLLSRGMESKAAKLACDVVEHEGADLHG